MRVSDLRVWIEQKDRKLARIEAWPSGDRCEWPRLASGPLLTGGDDVARLAPPACNLPAVVCVSRVRRFGRHHATGIAPNANA
jgi:hypothetical protein